MEARSTEFLVDAHGYPASRVFAGYGPRLIDRDEADQSWHTMPRPAFRLGPALGYLEIFSSSRPFVRGPINPIASMTISIAPPINMNTPVVPNAFNTPAMKNDVKMAEKRLHEYTKPTARARMLVGKSSV